MEAVIRTTFWVHRARLTLVSLPPSGCFSPNHSQTSGKSKQNTEKGIQLYRAVTSDGPFLLETGVCTEVGPKRCLTWNRPTPHSATAAEGIKALQCFQNSLRTDKSSQTNSPSSSWAPDCSLQASPQSVIYLHVRSRGSNLQTSRLAPWSRPSSWLSSCPQYIDLPLLYLRTDWDNDFL